MADKGWIKLYRQLQDSAIWTSDEPFSRRDAWIDLLLMVNHEQKEIVLSNGCPLTVFRGQHFTSVRKLGERWHWNDKKVRRYLNLLENLEMATIRGTRLGTMITIENWGKFQSEGRTFGRAEGSTEDSARGQQMGDEQEIKNVKNDKEEKNIGASLPLFSPRGERYE